MMYGYRFYLVIKQQEIEANNKQAEVEKKMYDDLLRERDILSKVIIN